MQTHIFKHGKIGLSRMVFSTALACVISVCYGMTQGVTAVLLPQLRQDEQFHYDGSEDSWIASVTNLSMILGGLFAGSLIDLYGRKLALILIGIPFIVGWTCIAFAKTTALIITGRLITGLSSGAHLPIILVYLTEIVDPKYRTIALAFPLSMLHVGVLFTHLIGSYCSWRVSAIISIFPPLFSSIGFLFLRESPLWLINKGRSEEGTDTFRWYRGTTESSEAELNAILQRPVDNKKSTWRDGLNVVCTHTFLKPFLITVLIVGNIQFSGIAVLYFYAEDVFERILSGEIDPFIMMMATDSIRGSLALLLCFLAKVLPKKISFIVASVGLSVFLYILVIYLFLFRQYGHMWVPVTCLVFYIAFSGFLNPLGLSFVPEIFPNNARGFGSGIASSLACLLQFIVVKVSPDVMNYYGEATLFASFATCSIVCGLTLIFLLPETRGKTLQSIEDHFNKDKKTEQTAL